MDKATYHINSFNNYVKFEELYQTNTHISYNVAGNNAMKYTLKPISQSYS